MFFLFLVLSMEIIQIDYVKPIRRLLLPDVGDGATVLMISYLSIIACVLFLSRFQCCVCHCIMEQNWTEAVDMILVFGECHKNASQAARVYAERYPERHHPDRGSFSNLCDRLRQT